MAEIKPMALIESMSKKVSAAVRAILAGTSEQKTQLVAEYNAQNKFCAFTQITLSHKNVCSCSMG